MSFDLLAQSSPWLGTQKMQVVMSLVVVATLQHLLWQLQSMGGLPLPCHRLLNCHLLWQGLTDRFYLFTRCTDTGVIATHALSFYRPLAPLFLLTRAQLAVVTQSCALLYIAAHCDLLFWWRLLFALPIVLLQYISQACWVLCSPRLDFFHRTVISTLVVANRLKIPTPPLAWSFSKLFIATSLSDKLWLTTSHQKLSKSSSWT